MASTNAGMKQAMADATTRVAFDLTPAMVDEVKRILDLTDLGSKPEVFRRAFTLLRIHVDAAIRGREIYMVDPERPNERYMITLPFTVKTPTSTRET
jgi:hypothetical protein